MPKYTALTPKEKRKHLQNKALKAQGYRGLVAVDPMDITSPSAMGEFLSTGAEALDVPGSIVRGGVEGMLKEDSGFLQGAGEQIDRLREKGSKGVEEGPKGSDIMEAAGVENEVGKAVGGFLTEMATDPLSYGPGIVNKVTKIFKPIERKIRSKAQKSASRVLSEYVSTSDFLKKGMNTDILGARLVEDDIMKYINNPEKLKEVLGGASGIERKQLFPELVSLKSSPKTGGRISEASDELAKHIDDVSSMSPDIKNKRVTNPVSYQLSSEMLDPVSGVPIEPKKIKEVEDFLKSIISKSDSKSMSIKDLYNLKKNLSKNISSKEFYKNMDETSALKKETTVGLIRQIDKAIKEGLEGVDVSIGGNVVDAAEYYSAQNNRLHQLLQINEVLQTVSHRDLKRVNLPQMLAESGLAGLTIGVGSGSPAAGVSGALMSGAWSARSRGKDLADPMLAKGIDMVSQYGVPLSGPIATQAVREMRDETPEVFRTPKIRGRSPDSFNPMSAQERMETNLPDMILKSKIPRTTEGLTENSQLFRLKIAQDAEKLAAKQLMTEGFHPDDVDPEDMEARAKDIYKDVVDIFKDSPEEVGALLPIWIKQYPSYFEKDRYQRIDGVVPQGLQPLVREEIRKNPNISNKERIEQLDLFNRSGEYNDK